MPPGNVPWSRRLRQAALRLENGRWIFRQEEKAKEPPVTIRKAEPEDPFENEPLCFAAERASDLLSWEPPGYSRVGRECRSVRDACCYSKGPEESGLWHLQGFDGSWALCEACMDNGAHQDITADEMQKEESRFWGLNKPGSIGEQVEVDPRPIVKADIKCVMGDKCQFHRPYAELGWLTCYYKLNDQELVCNACAETYPNCPELPQ